ncbi:hypothetical protein ON010_g11579 [Phytophthora cinnamomi]|nr:hypothetical protein ON010_g11579 [Phytophthora cinnamomi]
METVAAAMKTLSGLTVLKWFLPEYDVEFESKQLVWVATSRSVVEFSGECGGEALLRGRVGGGRACTGGAGEGFGNVACSGPP